MEDGLKMSRSYGYLRVVCIHKETNVIYFISEDCTLYPVRSEATTLTLCTGEQQKMLFLGSISEHDSYNYFSFFLSHVCQCLHNNFKRTEITYCAIIGFGIITYDDLDLTKFISLPTCIWTVLGKRSNEDATIIIDAIIRMKISIHPFASVKAIISIIALI